MKKKSQVSVEFMLIFTLIFVILIGIIAMLNHRITQISEQEQELAMTQLADSIKNEIVLASSVSTNYIRRFDMPLKISGKEYTLDLLGRDVSISLFEDDNKINEYYTTLPVPVKGTFISNMTEDTTDHCITKNSYDGIRISRNQASLDPNQSILSPGDNFEVAFSLNCIENIKSTQVTIKYDPTKLELQEVIPITRYSGYENWIFEEIIQIDFGTPYVNQEVGRYTLGMISKNNCVTGSGNIGVFKFTVLDEAAAGETKVEIDKTFEENDELLILDCLTSKNTKAGISDSIYNAKLIIN